MFPQNGVGSADTSRWYHSYRFQKCMILYDHHTGSRLARPVIIRALPFTLASLSCFARKGFNWACAAVRLRGHQAIQTYLLDKLCRHPSLEMWDNNTSKPSSTRIPIASRSCYEAACGTEYWVLFCRRSSARLLYEPKSHIS